MRLLIDSVCIGSPGILQVRDELARCTGENAPDGCDVVLLMRPGNSKIVGSSKLRIVTVEMPKGGWIGRWKWYHSVLPQIAMEHRADVLYALSGILSKRLCRSLGTITTVNNMIPFTPERLHLYPLFSRARLRYELLLRIYVSGLRMADSVILHSRHALETLKPFAGDISSKTFVVLTGTPMDMIFDHSDLPSHPYNGVPYFLYFSAIYPYKNHLRLIEAYSRANRKKPDLPVLLIAGLPEDKNYLKRIQLKIGKLRLDDKVKYMGIFKREEIPAWLYYAEINFFPSICETNPVTLAEILCSNGVLACSGVAPMPEVTAYAAELFDPYLVESITNVILRLVNNRSRCNDLRGLAQKRAAELSWSDCGKAIWEAARSAKNAFQERRIDKNVF